MVTLITGAAGFIGAATARILLKAGKTVIGIDNLNDYYNPELKHKRIQTLEKYDEFYFHKMDISNIGVMENFRDMYGEEITHVIHLAAQAGVRYSIENPYAYIASNLVGHVGVLEMCRNLPNLDRLIYASSSSVYGGNKKVPFSVDDRTDEPISLYAATKKADELLTHSYSELYKIPSIGLRFFTVYGPWGRPDMAYYSFTDRIFREQTISIFNNGEMRRDFTYIDDIVEGILACNKLDLSSDEVPHRIYNLGNNKPVELMHFLKTLENIIGEKAIIEMKGMQKGDVKETYANIDKTTKDLGWKPKTSIEDGLPIFVDWFREYYDLD